ncbi:methyl-accepting chemotaxis protein [Vibrio astriarenae]|uniref:methyl-accepting chemotaxis protein n=1 Tax=Vibrio astriarenae TaxID=1481923 RepID=UPI003735B1D3
MKLKNVSIKHKLLLMVLAAATLIIGMSIFNLFIQKEQQLQERMEKLEHQIETAVSLVNFYKGRSDLSVEEAKQQALDSLAALRYEDNNYYWITDTRNTLVMHPLRPTSVGNNMTNVRDGAGHYHWQEMSQIARTTGKGGLDYTWLSPQGELHDKISYVSYIREWDWIIGSGLFVSDIEQAFVRNIQIQIALSVTMVGLLFAASTLIGNSIVKPIEELLGMLKRIAGGDLTQSIRLKRQDEIGELAKGLDDMQATMKETLSLSLQTAEKASALSETIASTSEETSTSIRSQNLQLEQLSTAMTEMSSTIKDVASNAEHTSERTNQVSEQAVAGSESMNSTLGAVNQIASSIEGTSALMADLKKGVDNIGAVVQVIQEVSEQTNLLALNAAIEAARAGEQGRGFAVVADEVRNLASRTQTSTNEVQTTINALYENADKVLTVMEGNNQNIDATAQVANETKSTLDSMLGEMNHASSMVAQIAAAAEQQGGVANEMSENVSTIHLSAAEISQATHSLAEQTQEMVSIAEALRVQLSHFKIS